MAETTFKPGDKVKCPSKYGNMELIVKNVYPVPNAEQALVRHSQWVIVELDGKPLPSMSGYYFTKV